MPYGPDRRGYGAIVPCCYEIVLKERNLTLADVGKYLQKNNYTEKRISEGFSHSCPFQMHCCVGSWISDIKNNFFYNLREEICERWNLPERKERGIYLCKLWVSISTFKFHKYIFQIG